VRLSLSEIWQCRSQVKHLVASAKDEAERLNVDSQGAVAVLAVTLVGEIVPAKDFIELKSPWKGS